MTEKIESSYESLRFKVGDSVRITKYESIFSNGYTESWSKEIFVNDSLVKTNLGTYKIKDLNGEKIIRIFCEKELLFIESQTSYYPEPERVKAVLDLSNYATKKELEHATGVDTSNLAAKKMLLLLKLKLTSWYLTNWLMFQLI